MSAIKRIDRGHAAYQAELHWWAGYPLVMLGMAAACSLLYWRFKKAGWL